MLAPGARPPISLLQTPLATHDALAREELARRRVALAGAAREHDAGDALAGLIGCDSHGARSLADTHSSRQARGT